MTQASLLETDFDKEAWIANQIATRVRERNLNAICIFVGPTGAGKSYSALRLAELIDPSFSMKRVVFRATEFLDLINDPSVIKGNVVFWDEMGLGMPARDWQSVFNRSIGFVLQSFRFKNLILLMTVPDQSFIDSQARRLFHYFFECIAVHHAQEVVVAKPFIVDHNARFDKDYLKYPVVSRPDGPEKIGSIQFRKPSDGMRAAYEKHRQGFMDAYYRELRESLEMGGDAGKTPEWAWRILSFAASEATVPVRSDNGTINELRAMTQAELAGIMEISREWCNKLLRRASAALKIGG